MGTKFQKYLMMPIVLAGISFGWHAQAEVINFEGLSEGAIVSVVVGDGGSGPIGVEGINPSIPATNTAIIFDSDCPPGGVPADCSGTDTDLGTPNEDFGGPGVGVGGESGAPFQNDTAQENILIVAEDLVDVLPGPPDGLVDDPDDADEVGAFLNFDFTALGPVTIEAITLIDIEGGVESAEVSLYDAASVLLDTFVLPDTGNNGLAIDIPLGPTSGVGFMEVAINGSGGIDNIVFTIENGCTPGYWKQQQHFDSWTAPYDPTDLFTVFFENAYPGMDLLDVLKNNGNKTGLEALGRHTVAALLNAASPGVDYGLTEGEVIAMFNDVFPGTKSEYNDLKDGFADMNELGCPLN